VEVGALDGLRQYPAPGQQWKEDPPVTRTVPHSGMSVVFDSVRHQ
jgi:hypothetical protein